MKIRLFSMILVSCAFAFMCSVVLSDSTDQAQGDYDLSKYFFHANLDSDGGMIEYDLNYHSKDDSKIKHKYSMKRVRNGNAIEHIQNANVALLYFVKKKYIEQTWPGSDFLRKRLRYVDIGDTFVDDHKLGMGITDTCSVKDHFEELDVAEAADAQIVPNKIFKDVIHAYCRSKVHDVNGAKDYWTANKYYAYGIGLIAMEGDWTSAFGPFYATVDY